MVRVSIFLPAVFIQHPTSPPKKNPCIIISFIIPGNTRPIIENKSETKSFLGLPIDTGYQSHYVITNRKGNPVTKKKTKDIFDEIVLAVDAQVIPVFLISIDVKSVLELSIYFNREIPGDEDELVKDRNRRTIEDSKTGNVRKNDIEGSSKENVRKHKIGESYTSKKDDSSSTSYEELGVIKRDKSILEEE